MDYDEIHPVTEESITVEDGKIAFSKSYLDVKNYSQVLVAIWIDYPLNQGGRLTLDVFGNVEPSLANQVGSFTIGQAAGIQNVQSLGALTLATQISFNVSGEGVPSSVEKIHWAIWGRRRPV